MRRNSEKHKTGNERIVRNKGLDLSCMGALEMCTRVIPDAGGLVERGGHNQWLARVPLGTHHVVVVPGDGR